MSEKPILQVENVVKTFGPVTALAGVSIDVFRGEIVCFLGPSGCGKTTLLRVIGGFYQQDSGDVYLDEKLINGIPPEKRDTVMFFQNYALFPHMTVYENVTYGLRVRKENKQNMAEKAEQILSMIQLKGMEERYPNQLSGGQQQRVALARALILNPKLLLLDEPLSNLDANLRAHMRDEIIKIREKLNLTIIFVTHDQDEAISIADKIAVMRDGDIEQIGHPLHIYRYPSSVYVADFLGSANFLDTVVTAVDPEGKLEIETPIGKIKINPPINSFKPGDKAKAVMRPENFRVSLNNKQDQRGRTNILKAEIEKSTYLGAMITYRVRVGEVNLNVEIRNPTEKELLSPGDIIYLEIPEDIHLIEEEQAEQATL